MDRKEFLRGSGYMIGAGLAIPILPGFKDYTVSAAGRIRPDNWADVRNQFLLEPDVIHMAMMLLASHPKPVRDAIMKHMREFDKNPVTYWEYHFMTAEPDVLNGAAAYIGADPGEIALTGSTTEGLGTLYTGFKLGSGDEILTTTHDHYSTEMSLEYAVRKSGASIRRVTLYEHGEDVTADELTDRLIAAVGPATRLVAVTWVHSSSGMKLPIRRMSDAIRELNRGRSEADRVWFAVDGVHGFGVENITMGDLGCDYFVAGTHKWLFGPRGTGIIWAGRDGWDRLVPTVPAFSPAYGTWLGEYPEENLTFSDLFTPGGFHSFEHRWSLGEAFRMHMAIGKDKVQQRTHEFATIVKEELRKMPHVKLITPVSPELSSGITCFRVDGMEAGEVVERLHRKHIIASASPYRISYPRLTPCIINTEEEVEASLRAVAELG
ncbi:MAG: aminotransferase class V-fold PLP-dependent enzyme [Balneolaceae bacterium]|nr:MAG: aminotransferase class V-fold PLP-dependent enzyme [Balneolaceae bacterium]